MFILSPLHWVYCFFYFIFLYLTISSQDFISLWVMIEFLSLVFFCILLSHTTSTFYSSGILYFLIQSLSSFGLIFFWVFNLSSLFPGITTCFFMVFILINLGLFPFNFWYFYSSSNLPLFPFFLVLTFQKLPPLSIFSLFSSYFCDLAWTILLFSLVITVFSTLLLLSNSITHFSMVIISSIFNNIWFILASMIDFSLFILYFIIYGFLVYFLLSYSSSSFLYFTLIGLPPFPLFFLKFLIIYLSFETCSFGFLTPFCLFVVILGNVSMITLYFNFFSSALNSLYSMSFWL